MSRILGETEMENAKAIFLMFFLRLTFCILHSQILYKTKFTFLNGKRVYINISHLTDSPLEAGEFGHRLGKLLIDFWLTFYLMVCSVFFQEKLLSDNKKD